MLTEANSRYLKGKKKKHKNPQVLKGYGMGHRIEGKVE